MIDLSLPKQFLLFSRYPKTAGNFLLDKIIYSQKETPFPRLINLFITEECNFNCPMCHVRDARLKKKTRLSYANLRQVFDEAASYSSSFQITGGEPLLHPQIGEIIAYLTRKRIVKGLVTNGLLLDEKAEEVIKLGLDFLAISLDGPDEETQYKRGLVKGSFKKVVKGIKKAISLRGKKLFPNIRLATVITRNNLHNFDKLYELALTLGVDQWSLSNFFFYNNKILKEQKMFSKQWLMGDSVWGENVGEKQNYIDQKERIILGEKIKDLKKKVLVQKNKLRVSLPSCLDIEKYYSGTFPGSASFCNSPYRQVFIRSDGEVEICQGYILGNIRSHKLYDLWHSPKAKHFREIFAKEKITPACFRCCALNIKFD